MRRWLALAITAAAVALLLLPPLPVRADIPVMKIGPVSFSGTGNMTAINLAGQSSCAMVLAGTGSATITPQGSSDGGATWVTVATIGAQTANGTYGGAISPYLTTFRVAVTGVTGTVSVSEACSAAALPGGAITAGQINCQVEISPAFNPCTATATVPVGVTCTATIDNTIALGISNNLRPLQINVGGSTLSITATVSSVGYDPSVEFAGLVFVTIYMDYLCH